MGELGGGGYGRGVALDLDIYIYLRIVFENIHFIPRLGDFLAECPVYHVYVICIYPNEDGGTGGQLKFKNESRTEYRVLIL